MILTRKMNYKFLLSMIPAGIVSYLNHSLVKLTLDREVINLTLKGITKNLVTVYPKAIHIIRIMYTPIIFIAFLFLIITIINFIEMQLPKKEKKEVPKLYPEVPYNQNSDHFDLHIGSIHNERDLEITSHPKLCTITNANIFKNIAFFGVIGEGKTASGLLPVLQQIIYYSADDFKRKIGGFVTDVKGNFSKYVVDYMKDVGRDDDIILFRICGDYYYNFLYKPDDPASAIAWRLTEYLKAHNQSGNESYWVDQAKAVIEEAIKLLRLYKEDGYMTFEDLDKVIVDHASREEIIDFLSAKYESGKMSRYEQELFVNTRQYFRFKFPNLGNKIIGIIVSEVDRIVRTFTSDPLVKETFCPPKEKLNFPGFREIIEKGKVFIFDIPNERFRGVASMACSFAKLDHQSMILQRMSNMEYNQERYAFFLSDENHFIVTPNDGDFYSLGREAKHFSIVATQSVSQYLAVLKNENLVNSILNNLDNKFFMRNTDPKTLDYCLKISGKELKTYQNTSTSEAGKSEIDYFASDIAQDNKSISQSVSEVERKEEVFTQEFYSRVLGEFQAVGFINSGKTLAPIHFFKYWENKIVGNTPLKKAKPKNPFIFTSYMTTQEMIAKINLTSVNLEKQEKNSIETQAVFLLSEEEKEKIKEQGLKDSKEMKNIERESKVDSLFDSF